MAETDGPEGQKKSKVKTDLIVAAVLVALWILWTWANSGREDEFGNPGEQMSLPGAAHFVWDTIGDVVLIVGIAAAGIALWIWVSKRRGNKRG